MNNIATIKITPTTKVNQQILLDWQGYVIESTDTIFSTKLLHHRPAEEWSHFFESIFPVLHALKLDSSELVLPRITSVTNFTEGIFDCSFMRVEWGDNSHVLVWNIFDYSEELPKIQAAQQKFNEIQLRNIY
jgi:hypothetical protein